MRILLIWVLLTSAAAAQTVVGGVSGLPNQPVQPRDPRAALVGGKGVIRGLVTAADTGAPLRRAMVTISGPGGQRRAFTDIEGRYQFTGLPPGTYGVSASPGNHRPGYVTVAFGASGFSAPGPNMGKRITLEAGQVVEDINIALPRGGVIAGRVLDAYGEPAARVSVFPMMIRAGAEPMQTSASATTDDLGQFRLFGLPPGSYLVRADSRMGMFSSGPPEVEGERVGFATTYAPGTPSRADAVRIRVRPGAEVNVEIRLVETSIFKISGRVLASSGEPATRVDVSLVHNEPGSSMSFGSSIGPNGTFAFQNVPPGSYDIVARLQAARGVPPESGPMGPPKILEMGLTRVDVTTADVENVIVPMRSGETVTGEIVFDEPPPPGFKVNLVMQLAERRPIFSGVAVTVNGTSFTAIDLFGAYVVRGSVSGSGGPWFLKSVLLGGKDITDVPVAFTAGHSGQLQVVFTNRAATLEATVMDDAGSPTREAQIVVFGTDEESWRPFSSRIRQAGPPREGEGKFTVRGLLEGRYFAVAVPPGSLAIGGPQPPDRELMESLKKVATEVVLGAGETRLVELRLVRFEQ